MKKILTLCCIIVLFSSCENKKSEYKIGIIAPLTGEGATYGKAMKRGFDLAFEGKEQYQLIYEDSKLSPNDGSKAINKLIDFDNVEVVYGAAASTVTLAMAPIAEKNKIILFSSISTADDIKNSGDFVFRNVPSNYIQGITAAKFLTQKLKLSKIAILKENDDYGISIANSFLEQIDKMGANIVVEETYTSIDTDFRTQLIKVSNSGAEGLFIPGNYEESALILKQAKELSINIPIIGGDGSYSENLIEVAGQSAEDFYCTHFEIDKKSEFYLSFCTKFKEKYNKTPNVYEAYAYEAGMILLKSIEESKYNANEIKEKLYNTNFNSLTGNLKFNRFGDVERDFGILQVKEGVFTNIE